MSSCDLRFRCECGRSFPTEAALQRHTWVTRHAAAPPEEVKDPAREAVLAALRVLKAKQATQHQFERREQNLLAACTVMHQRFRQATRQAASCEEAVSSTSVLGWLRLVALLLIIGGLAATGLTL